MNNVIKYRTKLSFIADGENREFNFNFQIFVKENVNVYLDDVLQTEGFTVALDEVGGRVIFNVAPEKDIKITIIRNLPVRRTTDFQEGGPFRASRVNGEFDYQVACLEQIEEKLSRVIYKPPYLMDDSNLSLPEPVSGRTLIWSDDNSGLKNSKYDVDNLENQLTEAVKNVDLKWQNVLEKSNIVDYAYEHIIPNSHNIGEIFTDGFVELLDGQGWCEGDILPSGAYTGLVAEFDKYTADNNKGIAWIDFSTYEASLLANNGNCVLFGYDVVNNLIRLPSIKDHVSINQSVTLVTRNKYFPDQIQNFTGVFDIPASYTNGVNADGIVEVQQITGQRVTSTFSNGNMPRYKINASSQIRTGSETWGKHIARRYKIQIANVGVPASESQYTGFVEGLINKADVNAENFSPEGKNKIVSLGIPNYKAGISISLPYTAPSTGFFLGVNPDTNTGKLYIDGEQIVFGGSYTDNESHGFFVSKGSIISGTQSRLIFYPLKGVE